MKKIHLLFLFLFINFEFSTAFTCRKGLTKSCDHTDVNSKTNNKFTNITTPITTTPASMNKCRCVLPRKDACFNQPCKNKGICTNNPDGETKYKCECLEGYYGENCDIG